MAGSEIKIRLSTIADLKQLHEANAELAKLAQSVGQGNSDLRQSALVAARDLYSIGEAANKSASQTILSAKEIEEKWNQAWAGATTSTTKQLSKMEGAVSGILNGIGGKIQKIGHTIFTGGAMKAGAQLLVLTFKWAWDKIKEESEKAAKRIEYLFQDSLTKIKDGASEVSTAFEKTIATIDKSVSHFDAVTNSIKELAKAETELARQNAIANGISKEQADLAAADLNNEIDYEAERQRLENVIEMEQKRINAAKDAEEKTTQFVKKATEEKAAAEAQYAQMRDKYIEEHALKESAGTVLQSAAGAIYVGGISAERAAKSRADALIDFETSEEGKNAANKVKQASDALAGIKTDEKALAIIDEAQLKIETAQRELSTLEMRRDAQQLQMLNDLSTQIETESKAKADAEFNTLKKTAAEQAKLDEQRFRQQQRMEQELAAQRINDLRTELNERQSLESTALNRQNAAHGSLATAWGWYRDQSKMQAIIDERKAQAAAEVQWQKDFDRLKMWRNDWRTAEFGSLSAADEAVRQVAFAKEEKAAADRAVIETAENTRQLADKLEELIQMK